MYSTVDKDLVDQEGEGRDYGNLVIALSSDLRKASGYHEGGLTTLKNGLTGPEKDVSMEAWSVLYWVTPKKPFSMTKSIRKITLSYINW